MHGKITPETFDENPRPFVWNAINRGIQKGGSRLSVTDMPAVLSCAMDYGMSPSPD